MKINFLSSNIVVVIISIIVTFFGYKLAIEQQYEKDRLVHKVILDDFKLAFDFYTHPLEGIAGLFHVSQHQNVDYSGFAKYADSRNWFKSFKGVLGYGYIRRIPADKIEDFVKQQKLLRPNFQLKRLDENKIYPEAADFYVVEAVEPSNVNDKAVGLVISDESRRLEGAVKAMKTGSATLTRPIKLVQAEKTEVGFLLFLPIYKSSSTPTSEEERIKLHYGWAYAPLVASEIAEFVRRMKPKNIGFSFKENGNDGEMLYVDDEIMQSGPYVVSSTIELGGQNWTISSSSGNGPYLIIQFMAFFFFLFFVSVLFIVKMRMKQLETKHDFDQLLIEKTQKEVASATMELNKQKNFLQVFIDEIPAFVSCWDEKLELLFCNEKFRNICNVPNNNSRISINQVFVDSAWKKLSPELKKVIEGESVEIEFDYPQINLENQSYWSRLSPMMLDGQVNRVFMVMVDVSSMKKMERENREAQAMLFSHSKLSLLGEMAGGIAHEINNPLAIISGKAQVIEYLIAKLDFPSGTKQKLNSNLSGIQSTVERIAKIVNGLKDFSRDSTMDSHVIIDPKAIVESTLSLCSERMKCLGVGVTSHFEDFEGKIYCNVIQIEQVLMNLISNSMDAIESLQERWIKIIVTEHNDSVCFRVIDSGSGIEQKFLDKIMTPFFTTKEIGKGVGIGLSISRKIIEKHEGELRYELYDGHTSFVFSLPRKLRDVKKTA